MNFGNLSGLVNGAEQVVFDYTVSGVDASTISTGSILNGNEDGWYTIIFRSICANDSDTINVQFNGDSGSNYGYRGINAQSTTAQDKNGSSRTSASLISVSANANETQFGVAKLYAKSGSVRILNCIAIDEVSGTTVTSITSLASVWSNSADNIVSMTFVSGSDFKAGTRIIILKYNNFTNGTTTGVITTPYIKGAWVRVGSHILGSPASSITFSGLDGDRDVLYYLSSLSKASGGANNVKIKPNNDTTPSIYGSQLLYGADTLITAQRSTGSTGFFASLANTVNTYSQFNSLLFTKSGYLRPAITIINSGISGTTIGAMGIDGGSWNDTSNNITSLVIDTSPSGNNLYTGSQFELYALRPNG